MQFAVSVEGLVKRFGPITAVDGISFAVVKGEIFGILGPNGAGKTTTLEIIEGLQRPTQGKVEVLGLSVSSQTSRIKARIGVQLQSSSYFNYLRLDEILALLGSFYPQRAAPGDLLERVGLLDRAKSRVNELSGGQHQRFAVAASLVNDPELVILDEPTTGLDPQSRHHLWDLVRDVGGQSVTVVLTTHYMEEAETLCDRVAIMDHGRLLAVDSPRNLVDGMDAAYAVKLVMARPLDAGQLASLSESVDLVHEGEDNTYVLRLKNHSAGLAAVLEHIHHFQPGLEHLEIAPVTLEDVFLNLTGAEMRD